MNFTVVWDEAAEAELAAAWLTSPDKQAVTRAVNTLERRLQVDPANEGESRSGGIRVAFEGPVGLNFQVVVGGVVRVVRFWACR